VPLFKTSIMKRLAKADQKRIKGGLPMLPNCGGACYYVKNGQLITSFCTTGRTTFTTVGYGCVCQGSGGLLCPPPPLP
jgi:hypothetical protein